VNRDREEDNEGKHTLEGKRKEKGGCCDSSL
jgi:hypothetical protein